jgi:hypothetical protein
MNTFTITLNSKLGNGESLNLKNYFFCVAGDSAPNTCQYFSQAFDVGDSSASGATANIIMPEVPVVLKSGLVSPFQPVETATTGTGGAITSFATTKTLAESTVATTTVTPSATAGTVSSTSSKGGLSVGAKVGIALGALLLFALLLLAALCVLRRKHKQKTQPEQVMLTRSMHTDSFSRNLMTEKEEHIITASPTTGVLEGDHSPDTALPIQRHSALSPYEPVPSAPYTGAAANVPRRKPTNATMVSTVSRGISTNSRSTSGGALSPRSGGTSAGGFEEYHDVPIYGDARHSPQVFQGTAPFLTEEGMSAEEVARLEEEERRIDAAIAEADRRRWC